MDLGRAINYTPNHHSPIETLLPAGAHDGLGDSDALTLRAVRRDRKLGCMPYRSMAKTSTHTYTQGVVCVFVWLTMYMYSGLEGHAEGSIVTMGQHGGYN